jgi:hypothetical protein
MDILKNLAQNDDDTLAAYIKRFNGCVIKISLSTNMYLLFIQNGLLEGDFNPSLTESTP